MENPLAKLIPYVVGEYPKSFLKLYEKVVIPKGTNGETIKESLWKAYEFGTVRHQGQKRRSGKPYFSDHCLQVANILAKWKMDHITVMAGLLHDTLEDTDTTLKDLEDCFGEDITRLVDGVTKLGNIEFSNQQEKQAENFMKLLLSVAKDLRVIIIKFADRLHNMQTIEYMSKLKQRQIARETNDIYVPLAHRLGMASVKWELEDWVLQTLHKKSHLEIDSKLKSTNRQRSRYINQVISPIKEELKKYQIQVDIYGRPKSHSSIYRKMIARGKTFEEIYDLFAIRIIVEKVEQCYLTLGIIHQVYSPIQERFKDFIAMPKSNGYQSIHTTLIGPRGHMVEIQIFCNPTPLRQMALLRAQLGMGRFEALSSNCVSWASQETYGFFNNPMFFSKMIFQNWLKRPKMMVHRRTFWAGEARRKNVTLGLQDKNTDPLLPCSHGSAFKRGYKSILSKLTHLLQPYLVNNSGVQ